jgi:hypothetical protein
MPEGNANMEIAGHLREHGERTGHTESSRRRIETVEILEAVLLALVAVVTAYSGYQAARWDGESAKAYATSSRLRVQSDELQLTANQTLIYDASTFTAWLQAYSAGDQKLMGILARRFTPQYTVAFDAWLKLKPFENPKAPPGPRYMPQFKQPQADAAKVLANEATAAFNEGVNDRDRGEHYVRLTVILAAVLFLIAIGQRFQIRRVRYAMNLVAGLFLVYCIVLMATYPHV